ncbi:MAG: sigma 54-interacting transcriptional regulator [Deltaproteobacteria bacterium]
MSADSTENHRLPLASQWIRTIQRYRSDHPDLVRVLDVVERLQDRPYCTQALLLGEPGTGKEGLGRALHALMHAEDAPFVEASLGGRESPDVLPELFGHGVTPGIIERADGGTLYLDEVATLSRGVQARLLAAIRGRVRREGELVDRPVSVTIIGATDHDLLAEVIAGRFRHDLYWRLARLVLTLPPLRERRADIGRLAVWIGSRVLQKYGRTQRLAREVDSESDTIVLSREAEEVLVAHDWPGNIRELDAVLERTLLLYGDGPRVEREHVVAAIGRREATK